MISPFYFFVTSIVAIITSYLSIPGLLWGLQQDDPVEYEALGSPTESELFARSPSVVQWRFCWFVVSGRAYALTRGATRTHAMLAWLGYVGLALSIAALLVFGSHR